MDMRFWIGLCLMIEGNVAAGFLFMIWAATEKLGEGI